MSIIGSNDPNQFMVFGVTEKSVSGTEQSRKITAENIRTLETLNNSLKITHNFFSNPADLTPLYDEQGEETARKTAETEGTKLSQGMASSVKQEKETAREEKIKKNKGLSLPLLTQLPIVKLTDQPNVPTAITVGNDESSGGIDQMTKKMSEQLDGQIRRTNDQLDSQIHKINEDTDEAIRKTQDDIPRLFTRVPGGFEFGDRVVKGKKVELVNGELYIDGRIVDAKTGDFGDKVCKTIKKHTYTGYDIDTEDKRLCVDGQYYDRSTGELLHTEEVPKYDGGLPEKVKGGFSVGGKIIPGKKAQIVNNELYIDGCIYNPQTGEKGDKKLQIVDGVTYTGNQIRDEKGRVLVDGHFYDLSGKEVPPVEVRKVYDKVDGGAIVADKFISVKDNEKLDITDDGHLILGDKEDMEKKNFAKGHLVNSDTGEVSKETYKDYQDRSTERSHKEESKKDKETESQSEKGSSINYTGNISGKLAELLKDFRKVSGGFEVGEKYLPGDDAQIIDGDLYIDGTIVDSDLQEFGFKTCRTISGRVYTGVQFTTEDGYLCVDGVYYNTSTGEKVPGKLASKYYGLPPKRVDNGYHVGGKFIQGKMAQIVNNELYIDGRIYDPGTGERGDKKLWFANGVPFTGNQISIIEGDVLVDGHFYYPSGEKKPEQKVNKLFEKVAGGFKFGDRFVVGQKAEFLDGKLYIDEKQVNPRTGEKISRKTASAGPVKSGEDNARGIKVGDKILIEDKIDRKSDTDFDITYRSVSIDDVKDRNIVDYTRDYKLGDDLQVSGNMQKNLDGTVKVSYEKVPLTEQPQGKAKTNYVKGANDIMSSIRDGKKDMGS